MTGLVAFGETALGLAPPDHERIETAEGLGLRADGTESNVATAATRLGASAVWVSKLPNSPLGKRAVAELAEHGLETDVVWADEGRQGLTFAERGSAPRAGATIQDRTDTAAATAEPGELPTTLVQEADYFLTAGSTAALGPTARRTTEAMLRAANGTRVFDLDFQPGLWGLERAREELPALLEAVDVLTGTEAEFREVFDRSGQARELVHGVAAEFDFEQVLVTRGADGAVVWDDNVIHQVEGVETDTVDTAGQHEAVVGAYLQQVLDDAAIERALVHGVAAGALTRTLPGPLTTITPAEVAALIADEFDTR